FLKSARRESSSNTLDQLRQLAIGRHVTRQSINQRGLVGQFFGAVEDELNQRDFWNRYLSVSAAEDHRFKQVNERAKVSGYRNILQTDTRVCIAPAFYAIYV